MQKAVEVVGLGVGGVIVVGRHVDGGLEGEGTVPLQGVRSVMCQCLNVLQVNGYHTSQ